MRHAFRQRLSEEEEESVFVSMTDMTVSFLFIVMILLAFFASQIAPGETVPKHELEEAERVIEERDLQISQLLEELQSYRTGDPTIIPRLQAEKARLEARVRELEGDIAAIHEELDLDDGDNAVARISLLREELQRLHELLAESSDENLIERYNTLVSLQRAEILHDLRDRIVAADPSIDVSISRNQDALQFRGDGLFASNSTTPSRQGREKMRLIAGILQDVVACFSLGDPSAISGTCNEHVAIVDALQIEGHADSVGSDTYNMDLSARRGAAIYGEMIEANPLLLDFMNLREQPVLSVSGYGEGRPIADETVPGGRDANRRIDIRFIMFSPADEVSIPSSLDDLARVRDLLLGGRSE
ncbi:OmpA family protein [Rhodobacteraceae bacterium R_SAG6]|nr:OmpA family protein [Rhodobacteraceae bacterium R_SAG6]